MSKRYLYILGPILLLLVIYLLGPSPAKPKWDKTMPVVPQTPVELEQYIGNQEARHKIKPDNEARIVWYDSSKKKTEYSVVYLHGFSASQEEGDPIHTDFAKKFGCNLYLARLADHGIDTTEQLMNFTGDRFWESSKEALAIGKALGEKVIVMSTSTGGTTALMLAAEYPDDVYAMINMSPNIAINDPNAWLLNNPWGLQIARKVVGGNYVNVHFDSARQKYWNGIYRLEAAVQLQEMIEDKMKKETFEKVKCPVLTLYYYKNEKEQDPTVKVSAMLEMVKELGTPASFNVAVPVPNGGAHVIGSYLVSKDLETVRKETEKFAIEKLKMTPVN
jgi:pimeloyl-ACP methyl ester carboxylesterase